MGGRPQGSPLRKRYKGCRKTGRCGERTERCRWQRKRSERVAAVKILSVRRKAAQKFGAPQQDHRPLQKVIDGAVCGGTHGSRPTGRFCRAGPACPAGGAGKTRSGRCRHRPLRKRNKRCNGRATARVAPTKAYLAVRRGGALPLPRAGKSAKRCQWQMKRVGFEEVPRLADTTVTGNRLARRWAREPRPYESVTRGVRKESPSHGFAVPAPFRQGGRGDGGRGLPQPVYALASQ